MLQKILSPHWLHKNIQPSKGEGTKMAKCIIEKAVMQPIPGNAEPTENRNSTKD